MNEINMEDELTAEATAASPKRMPTALVIIIDILLIGVTLVVFSLFHHVIPRKGNDDAVVVIPTSPSVVGTVDEHQEEPGSWKNRFSNKFSSTFSNTDTTYKSPNVSVSIATIEEGTGKDKITYHIADIFISHIEYFRTKFAKDTFGSGFRQSVLSMDEESDAIVAMTGDYYGNSTNNHGVVIRNGVFYRSTKLDSDVCVLYRDGTMETYPLGTFDLDSVMARSPWQAWTFGPALIDANGKAIKEFSGYAKNISVANPRSAVGYFEPGHYCFVVVDGRQDGYSKGATMQKLAEIFEGMGCKAAYNLDGGASAVMTFNDSVFTRPCGGGRSVSDCLLITEVWD